MLTRHKKPKNNPNFRDGFNKPVYFRLKFFPSFRDQKSRFDDM